MGYEIDFLAVGEESKGGDAIAIRYGNLLATPPSQTVIVIDGGYTATGHAMVNHIKTRFGTSHVDMVVSTHPDQDHVCGLEVVLEELSVGQLIMHQPWKHSVSVEAARSALFKSSSLSQALEASLKGASDLEAIANRRDIPIVEPFAGTQTPDGAFQILGPPQGFYEIMLSNFQQSSVQRIAAELREMAKKLLRSLVSEDLYEETLRDDGTTSPQNNTSVISLLTVDGQRFMFTGDAGIPALEQAVSQLEGSSDWAPGSLRFVQVPHHGSRRNVGPSVLDRLLGPKGQLVARGSAFVSAPAKNPEAKHPAKKVLNAFNRRGFPVCATQGRAIWHHRDAPDRPDYSAITPFDLFPQVEEDSEA